MDWFNSLHISLLNKSLDGLWAREQAISNNIANVDTPNYKSYTVSFEEELKAALDRGKSKTETVQKIQSADIKVKQNHNLTMRLDGNNVDLETEQIEMARTQLNYLYSLRQISDEFARLRHVISEGRR
ncbi:MAG TPA: flagellar basal body rod protein FlgB [Clostridiales bacterium]|nr:flagellar basal body rod protein FlgB [Clostridiales bacterium]